MIKRILVAIDHSDKNQAVFDSALSLAKATSANLMLLNVVSEQETEYPVLPTSAYYPYPMLDDRDYKMYQERLTEYKQWGLCFLQDLTEKALSIGIEAEYTQLTGNPGRMICELAHNWEADLIIIGSRGLKGIKEMVLGSVSNYVSHHAPCSVLILRTVTDEESNSDSVTSEKSATNNNSKEPFVPNITTKGK